MGSTLYLECAAGISGDMAVAALLDAGASESELRRVLDSLPVDGFEVRVSRVKKSGLDVCDFDVVLDEAHQNHDHDMDYLHGSAAEARCAHDHGHDHAHAHASDHGHAHGHPHEHACDHDHGYDHAHSHAHNHTHAHIHDHAHEHRSPRDIASLINASAATPGAKELAHRIFAILAHAEAQAHGVPLDEVHFHEVGAVDSIVDILSFAVCFDNLGITDVVVAELAEGKGTVRCQHGVLPVPVPAVTNIVRRHGIPLRMLDVRGELVTPTGAAIAAAVRTRDALPERFVIEAVGMGAGKRDYATAGILRVFLVSEGTPGANDVCTKAANNNR